MALTEERLQEVRETTVPIAASDRDPRRWRSALGIAWLVLFPLGLALEPTPAASGPEPWWAVVASIGLLVAIGATGVGLARRAAWGPGASLVASGIFAVGVFACPATGHHAFGLWWIGEFAASLALLSISGAAYLRTRAGSAEGRPSE